MFSTCIQTVLTDQRNNKKSKPDSVGFGQSRHGEGFEVGVLRGDDLGHVLGSSPTLLIV